MEAPLAVSAIYVVGIELDTRARASWCFLCLLLDEENGRDLWRLEEVSGWYKRISQAVAE